VVLVVFVFGNVVFGLWFGIGLLLGWYFYVCAV